VEEGDEGGDVVALERVHVTGDQLLLLGVDDAHLGRVHPALGQRGPRSLERAVHGRDGGVEQLGDLRGLPTQHLAQDQHGPLPRREVLEGGDEGELDALADRGQLGWVAVLGDDAGIGDGLHPRLFGPGEALEGVGGVGRTEVHRLGPPLAATKLVEAHVGGDAVQPRAQRRAALEGVETLPGPDHGLLHGVVGLERRAEHPVAVARELPPVDLEVVRPEVGGGGAGGRGGSGGAAGHSRHPTGGFGPRLPASSPIRGRLGSSGGLGRGRSRRSR
jgi:hypothetical protein